MSGRVQVTASGSKVKNPGPARVCTLIFTAHASSRRRSFGQSPAGFYNNLISGWLGQRRTSYGDWSSRRLCVVGAAGAVNTAIVGSNGVLNPCQRDTDWSGRAVGDLPAHQPHYAAADLYDRRQPRQCTSSAKPMPSAVYWAPRVQPERRRAKVPLIRRSAVASFRWASASSRSRCLAPRLSTSSPSRRRRSRACCSR